MNKFDFDNRWYLTFSGTLYILTNGYEKFQSIYPFMCSDRQIRSTVDRNKYLTVYPNSVIENFLYIGSGVQAKNWKIIRDLNITHIINCSIEHECVFQDVCKYLHVKVEDNLNENIYDELDGAHLFIEKALDTYDIDIVNGQYVKEPKILIHCNLGISRSSSILIAYIIKKYKFCLKSTINYVRDKRIQVAPNCNFLRQLKLYEEVVL
jgi:serine/threonine/tyrosine-interacting-like protein 1